MNSRTKRQQIPVTLQLTGKGINVIVNGFAYETPRIFSPLRRKIDFFAISFYPNSIELLQELKLDYSITDSHWRGHRSRKDGREAGLSLF